MKQLSVALIASAMIVIAPIVMAEDSPHEFSANVALSTDYMYRGISQSDEQPAISGGFDYRYTTGGFADLYAGIWASSLDFNDGDTTMEIDYYGGIAGEFSHGISWDVGGFYYQYPGTNADPAADFYFFEVYGKLAYTFADVSLEPTIGFGLSYSPDFFGEDGDGVYYTGSLDLFLAMGFGLSFLVGHQDVDGEKTVCIPRCNERVRNLFVTICDDHLQIERADAFKTMLRPFVEKVLQDIELNPDHDELAVQAIRNEADDLLLPKVSAGGYVV